MNYCEVVEEGCLKWVESCDTRCGWEWPIMHTNVCGICACVCVCFVHSYTAQFNWVQFSEFT